MRIAWWEFLELESHLQDRSDLWMKHPSRQGWWIRTDRTAEALCVVAVTPPDKGGPYRMYEIQMVPVGLSDSEAQQYLAELLDGWTSYGYRLWIQQFLIDELKVAPNTAQLAAIAISCREQQPKRDPEQAQHAAQEDLLPNSSGGGGSLEVLSAMQSTFFSTLVGNTGFLKLELSGDLLAVRISLDDGVGFHNSGQLKGFVRPFQGSCRDTMLTLSRRGEVPVDLRGEEQDELFEPATTDGDNDRPEPEPSGDL